MSQKDSLCFSDATCLHETKTIKTLQSDLKNVTNQDKNDIFLVSSKKDTIAVENRPKMQNTLLFRGHNLFFKSGCNEKDQNLLSDGESQNDVDEDNLKESTRYYGRNYLVTNFPRCDFSNQESQTDSKTDKNLALSLKKSVSDSTTSMKKMTNRIKYGSPLKKQRFGKFFKRTSFMTKAKHGLKRTPRNKNDIKCNFQQNSPKRQQMHFSQTTKYSENMTQDKLANAKPVLHTETLEMKYTECSTKQDMLFTNNKTSLVHSDSSTPLRTLVKYCMADRLNVTTGCKSIQTEEDDEDENNSQPERNSCNVC